MLGIIYRLAAGVLFVLFCGVANASCTQAAAGSTEVEATARITTMLGKSEYIVEIIQPQGVRAACLLFRRAPKFDEVAAEFELELPGQLGLHVVILSRDYLVVESGTANGSYLSGIFAAKGDKLTRLKSIGSRTPPNFIMNGGVDLVLITDASGRERRVPL